MKILFGYDGSECAKAALDDLKNAGLPAGAEVLVLSVTENWTMIFEKLEKESSPEDRYQYPDSETIRRIREKHHAAFAETEKMARCAADRLQKAAPSWSVRAEALPGFAHWGILEKAGERRPDLIVVGSHGRGLAGRLLLGSSSLRILTEAPCAVRVARCSPARTADDDSPPRIVIGLDGSPDSLEAVEAVSQRLWREGSAVRLVSAIEPVLITATGFDVDLDRIEQSHALAAGRLKAAGLHVSTAVRIGDAKGILLDEAERWGADAISIGARGHGLVERVLLGSVSYAVAARAHCSVEVVRKNSGAAQ